MRSKDDIFGATELLNEAARGVHRQAQGDLAQASALFRETGSRYAELGRSQDQMRCLSRAQRLSH
jgi:hypothetical protein